MVFWAMVTGEETFAAICREVTGRRRKRADGYVGSHAWKQLVSLQSWQLTVDGRFFFWIDWSSPRCPSFWGFMCLFGWNFEANSQKRRRNPLRRKLQNCRHLMFPKSCNPRRNPLQQCGTCRQTTKKRWKHTNLQRATRSALADLQISSENECKNATFTKQFCLRFEQYKASMNKKAKKPKAMYALMNEQHEATLARLLPICSQAKAKPKAKSKGRGKPKAKAKAGVFWKVWCFWLAVECLPCA